MIASRLRVLSPLAAFVLLTSALATGCGGSTVEDVCNVCKSDSAKVNECKSGGAKAQSRAEEAGCGSEFQAFIDCAVEKATCSAIGEIEADACNPESNAAEACMGTD